MKGVLSKYKSKDEGGYGSGFAQGALQARIEGLAAEIAEIETLL